MRIFSWNNLKEKLQLLQKWVSFFLFFFFQDLWYAWKNMCSKGVLVLDFAIYDPGNAEINDKSLKHLHV